MTAANGCAKANSCEANTVVDIRSRFCDLQAGLNTVMLGLATVAFWR